MVRAGLLRQRITLQEDNSVQGRFGQKTPDWEEFAVVWADVRAIGGAERFAAQQVVPMLNYKITIRHRGDLRENMRIVLESGALLDIQSILDPNGRKEVLEILCVERGHEE